MKITANANKPDANGKQTVTLTITIEQPWHLYANPVGQEDLASAATVVDITGKMKPQSVKVDYPKGTLEKDIVVGNYMIYEKEVVIKADVIRAKGDTGPLKASVKIQACSSGKTGTCLFPATVDVEVK